jgi:ASCH domain-containing protein
LEKMLLRCLPTVFSVTNGRPSTSSTTAPRLAPVTKASRVPSSVPAAPVGAADAVPRAHGDGDIPTVAAAGLDEDGRTRPRRAEQLQRLRFRAGHLPAVRDGSKRVTMRFEDPVQVGPALLVFEFDDEITLPGRITSTVAKRIDSITDDEAREDGFARAADVLPGLLDYYPQLRPDSEIVIVRFEVDDD